MKHILWRFTVSLALSACIVEQPEFIVRVNEPQILPSVQAGEAPALQTGTQLDVNIEQAESPSPNPIENQEPGSADSAVSPLPVSPTASPLPETTAEPSAVPTPTPIPTSNTIFAGGGSGVISGGSNGGGSGASIFATPPVSIASIPTQQFVPGESQQLYGRVHYADGSTSTNVKWNSSDLNVAQVNASGLVQIMGVGSVTITAYAPESNIYAEHLLLNVTHAPVNFSGTISYVIENDIYIMKNGNQNPIQVTHSPTVEKPLPRLSWDGSQVTYRDNSSGHDIALIDTSGTGTPVLRDLIDNLVHVPYFWFNDEILYSGIDDGNPALRKIYRIKPDGSQQGWTNTLGPISGAVGGATPSGLFAFEYGGQVFTSTYDYNADTNAGERINYGLGADVRMAQNANPKYLVFTLNNDIVLQTLGGGQSQITDHAGYDGQAALSPDEQQVVFVSTRGNGSKDIFIMNRDGSNVRNLTHSPDINETAPDWSH